MAVSISKIVSGRWVALAALALSAMIGSVAASPAKLADELDGLKLNQVRMLGSHNSYRPYPSPATEQRIKTFLPQDWLGLAYGHPPLETQLQLGLHQFEIDVAPDSHGGQYAATYADATPEVKALMAAPGAKVIHIAGLDYNVHCLTFRKCLGIFARWSDAHPGHEPVVILINSVDHMRAPYWPYDAKFDQAGIDALNTDVEQMMGAGRVLTPDEVRGAYPTLRDAVLAKAWPTLGRLRGKFIFVLDGNGDHERFLRSGHPSLKGREMFGWFDEDAPEAAFFNIQDPVKALPLIQRLVGLGYMVRTRADADTVEARRHDGRRMKAALASGAQIVSTDYYAGVPDPEGIGYVADFEGPYLRCDEVTARCPARP
jgi:hypothetical protein